MPISAAVHEALSAAAGSTQLDIQAVYLFEMADKDADGILTRAEMTEFVQHTGCPIYVAEAMRSVVASSDKAGWREVWERLDADRDGEITKTEFVTGLTTALCNDQQCLNHTPFSHCGCLRACTSLAAVMHVCGLLLKCACLVDGQKRLCKTRLSRDLLKCK